MSLKKTLKNNNPAVFCPKGETLLSENQRETKENSQKKLERVDTSVYILHGERWLMLVLFGILSALNSAIWISFSPIAMITSLHYNVSITLVNALSTVYLVAYIPLVFPASWFLERKGLRNGLLLGAFLNAIGAWLRFSGYNKYYLLILGQTFSAIAQAFILGVPALLAAIWFGPEEWGLATSLGVLANQIGTAFGFLTSSFLVTTGNDFFMFLLSQAIASTVIFVIMLHWLSDKPPTPPSCAFKKKLNQEQKYGKDILTLLKNKSFLSLLNSYGISVGAYYAITTLIEQIMRPTFPDRNYDYGMVGFTIIMTGLVGTIIIGFIMDKCRKYKIVMIVLYFLSTLSYALFMISCLKWTLVSVYITSGIFGLIMTSVIPTGFELAADITYPISEVTSSGLLNCFAQIYGIILIIGIDKAINNWSWLGANWILVGSFAICTFFTNLVDEKSSRRVSDIDQQKIKLFSPMSVKSHSK